MTSGGFMRAATAVAGMCLVVAVVAAGASSNRVRAVGARKAAPIYLNDPGLTGLAIRPAYISSRLKGQTWRWIRDIHWRTWSSEGARGSGLFEVCTFGRCRRAMV